MGLSGVGWGWVGLRRGWACVGVQFTEMQLKLAQEARWVGPSGVGWGRGMHWGPIKVLVKTISIPLKLAQEARWDRVRLCGVGWGWGGVGHALGSN